MKVVNAQVVRTVLESEGIECKHDRIFNDLRKNGRRLKVMGHPIKDKHTIMKINQKLSSLYPELGIYCTDRPANQFKTPGWSYQGESFVIYCYNKK